MGVFFDLGRRCHCLLKCASWLIDAKVQLRELKTFSTWIDSNRYAWIFQHICQAVGTASVHVGLNQTELDLQLQYCLLTKLIVSIFLGGVTVSRHHTACGCCIRCVSARLP
jgi:hypothetical protein